LPQRISTGLRCGLVIAALLSFGADPASAFRIHDAGPFLGADGPVHLRWDAAPRLVTEEERSLDGGLRYSLEGGSYEAFRDLLDWGSNVPTSDALAAAISDAFDAWTVTDPASGLGTSLYFVPDLATEVYDNFGDPNNIGSFLGVNYGAEIDLLVETTHYNPFFLASVIFFIDVASFGDLTLTSGTTDYAGFAISGADIRFNPAYSWTLDEFRIVLTHEIGHALGFGDAEVFPDALGLYSSFLDDNYDGTDSASALATLTNSFAHLIDPFDPDSTPLLHVPGDLYSDPGLLTDGVDVLMESAFNRSLAIANPVLQHDDFAGRQFLYPVPEPTLPGLAWLGLAALAIWLKPGR
jgi:hypothetical protein